jgi:type VI secretion system protein ImpK
VLSLIAKALRPNAPSPPAEHPLVEGMYWASLDLLTLASQLGQGALPPSAHDLRRHIGGMLTAMETRALAAGIPPEDVRDAYFPIFALLDEILVQVQWPGAHDWRAQPLQFVHFHENSAGESFFTRVEALLRQPHRAHVLSVYFYCLALGFQGRYATRGGQGLEAIYDAVAAAVHQNVAPSEAISPHGVATDGGRFFQRQAPIVRVSLGLLAIALLLFLVLRVTLSFKTARAQEPMDDYARRAGVGAP